MLHGSDYNYLQGGNSNPRKKKRKEEEKGKKKLFPTLAPFFSSSGEIKLVSKERNKGQREKIVRRVRDDVDYSPSPGSKYVLNNEGRRKRKRKKLRWKGCWHMLDFSPLQGTESWEMGKGSERERCALFFQQITRRGYQKRRETTE